MSKHLGHKVTAEKILPLIVPLLVEETLTAEQFETQLSVCKKLMQRVETQRKKEYATKSEQQAEAGAALGSSKTEPEAPKAAPAEPQDHWNATELRSAQQGHAPEPRHVKC